MFLLGREYTFCAPFGISLNQCRWLITVHDASNSSSHMFVIPLESSPCPHGISRHQFVSRLPDGFPWVHCPDGFIQVRYQKWSGKRAGSPPPTPLRTHRASFPAMGSSIPKPALCVGRTSSISCLYDTGIQPLIYAITHVITSLKVHQLNFIKPSFALLHKEVLFFSRNETPNRSLPVFT